LWGENRIHRRDNVRTLNTFQIRNVTVTFLERSPRVVLGSAVMGHSLKARQKTRYGGSLPGLVLDLAREDRGDEGEDEQRDLRLAELHEQLNRSVARDESREAREHHTPAADDDNMLNASCCCLALTNSANSSGISEKESTPSIFQREPAIQPHWYEAPER
jgi:hypothetical protein